MSWKVRHEGSPQGTEVGELSEVVQGLQDGLWEPTDEVMGPQDAGWVAIESHPQLEEVAADIEPPPPPEHDDEARLDMNPLIDVCLVLLVFFILTTTYAVLQKQLEAPEASGEKAGPVTLTTKQVQEQMIPVTIKLENGEPVFRVADVVVSPDQLEVALRNAGRAASKTRVLLQYDDEVPQSAVVKVLDAAHGAKMERVSVAVPDRK